MRHLVLEHLDDQRPSMAEHKRAPQLDAPTIPRPSPQKPLTVRERKGGLLQDSFEKQLVAPLVLLEQRVQQRAFEFGVQSFSVTHGDSALVALAKVWSLRNARTQNAHAFSCAQ
jgi:hypothetical protein